MEPERKAVGKQLLKHGLHLLDGRHAGYGRLSLDIKLVGVIPSRSPDDLLWMEVVREFDQVGQGGVESGQQAAPVHPDSPTDPFRVRRLDGRYFELRLSLR